MDQSSPPNLNLSLVSIEGALEEITNQDIVFWNKNGEVADDECRLTKHGYLQSDIHQHFRKLEPEYCSHISDDVLKTQAKKETQNVKANERITQGQTTKQIDDTISTASSKSEKHLSFSREDTLRSRKRHISEESQMTGGVRSSMVYQESLVLSRSPGLRTLDFNSSAESLHSDQNLRISRRQTPRNLYDVALLCCQYPELAKTQNSEDEDYSNILPTKDYIRSISERLAKYLGDIFHMSKLRHKNLRVIQTDSKRGKLDQDLRQQLIMLETDSNPYYSPDNFLSSYEYKLWQDRERKDITELLGNRIPKSSGQTPKNRCMEYRKILKKVMVYDLDMARKQADFSVDKLSSDERHSDNTWSDSRSYCNDRFDPLLSKCGRRLLSEFATRYRVGVTTQLCFFLHTAEECLQDDSLPLDNVTFRILTNKLDMVYSLIEDQRPFCISEIETLIFVTEKLIHRIQELVIMLLTVWQPSTRELRNGLELARAAYQVFDALKGNEISEWPDCLSSWFESATIEKYHACKQADFENVPEMVLASVTHAINVMKMMQNGNNNERQTDYEAVFGGYISNFPQAVSTGLYDAVMADVKHLSDALPWIKSAPPSQGQRNYNDSLDLHDIALAYKLTEFDNLVKIREIDATKPNLHERNFSWRKAYHPLAMHWLDVLSCHMRKQVVKAVSQDIFDSPEFDDDFINEDMRNDIFTGVGQNEAKPNSEFQATRLRYGSLLRRDAVEQEGFGQSRLSNLEEEEDCQQYDNTESDSSESTYSPNNSDAEFTILNSATNSEKTIVNSYDVAPDSPQPDADNQPICKLVSFKPLVENVWEKDSNGSESFHSCKTGDSSSNMLKSAENTSDRTYSSAISNSDVEISCSSTIASDGDSSTLPQILPTKIYQQNISEVASSNGNCQDKTNHKKEIPCNVSSSLIDVVAIITRFKHFVQTINNTVYSLPTANECDEASVISLADHGNCIEAREMKNRFVQKAAETMCGVIQQYANNLLSIDLQFVSSNTAMQVIDKKLFHQIKTGIYNGTISRRHSILNSYHVLESQHERNEEHSKKMIIRLNNLLVLKHGMLYFWDQMERLSKGTHTLNMESRTTDCSTDSNSLHISHSNLPSTLLEKDQSELGSSSDDVTQTSSSACTVISQTDIDDEINNNNDTDDGEDDKELTHSTPETIVKIGNEFVSDAWSEVETSEHSIEDVYTVSTIGFLKERNEVHLDKAVNGVGELLTLHASDWFGVILNNALDNPPETKKGNDKKVKIQFKRLKSHLYCLLDMFSLWTHKEGINALHTEFWLQMIEDLKCRIISLKQLENGNCRIFAEHIRNVFTCLIQAWYKHPSQPNDGDLDWLAKPIRPSLTLLELYCMPTPTLFNVYNECRHEQLPVSRRVSSNSHLNEVDVLCMRILQDKKSFSGEILHHTLLSVLMVNKKFSNREAHEKALEFCQKMMTNNLVEFVFKRAGDGLPDIIPVVKSSQDDLRKVRSESMSTGESQQSSISTEDSSSGESVESDMQKIFSCRSDHFYRFSEKKLPISILDDVRQATRSIAEQDDTFLINLLRSRGKTDKEARLLLLEHGLIKQNMMKSCFSCFG